MKPVKIQIDKKAVLFADNKLRDLNSCLSEVEKYLDCFLVVQSTEGEYFVKMQRNKMIKNNVKIFNCFCKRFLNCNF